MEAPLTPKQFEALRQLDGCSVATAIESFNVRLRNEGFANPAALHCIFDDLPPMLGYAVTGRIRSAAPPIASSLPPPQKLTFADRDEWWNYALSIPEPRVLVLTDNDPSPGLGAFVGDVHAAVCKALGCVGYVTNGAVRDLGAVRAMGFHFFAGFVSVSHAYAHIVDFGEPVEIGGMRVRPGDLVHGDRHGVQTIPRGIASQIPPVAACLQERERSVIDCCRAADFSLNKLRATIKDAEMTYNPERLINHDHQEQRR